MGCDVQRTEIRLSDGAWLAATSGCREAHRESVTVALDEMEKYVQARIGGNVPAQTTGAWAVAKFEHDSSRPVDGYAAPQLHTHAVVFNVTETADGNTRALQPQELYKTQQYATAVYRSELAAQLQGMGYEIERGEHGQPEIKGYSREYLEASSPRRQQIKEQLRSRAARAPGLRRSRRIRRAERSSCSRAKKSEHSHQAMATETRRSAAAGCPSSGTAPRCPACPGRIIDRRNRRHDRADDGQKRLYVIDESSMASTKQMHTFVERLKENDRLLFVGDTRQHEAVEAGRPYAQLQEAGLRTARLDEIIRQKDPALKEVVEHLARGEVRDAIRNLNEQGRVHEIGDRQERIAEIAREYVRSPENTLVVSPDNESRREINGSIHRAMQEVILLP